MPRLWCWAGKTAPTWLPRRKFSEFENNWDWTETSLSSTGIGPLTSSPETWGQSLTNRQSVAERMLPRIAVSAQLAVMAVAIAVIVAIPFGVIAAVRQDTLIDYGLRFFSMIFESMPNFWLGLLVLVGLAVIFDWKPPISYRDLWEDPWTNLQVMFFPALVVGARGSAGMLRMTRSSVLEVLREDYVRTAHAKGLQQAKILFIHVPAQRSAARYHPCGFRGRYPVRRAGDH